MSRTDSDVDDIPYDSADYETVSGEGEGEGDEEFYEESLYHSEDFISTSIFGEHCTLTSDVFEFDFSFGYDCKRYYNLVVADEQTLVFASGNFINFFNTETKEIWFRRSALGGGIGHITKNPNPDFPHIAVAENGHKPPIIIYTWPNLDIVTVLKGGAARIYSHVAYNPNGSLLVSQSGDPDYLITVWNWPKSRILLRTKSYSNDVYRVMFSPSVPGHLTSCGVAHIKFWKMAKTFTGLKLQGELGRFGKTEYSDILGIYPMPDEKVISGCYWGNFLVWDEGLIKLEVFRKLRKNCHDGPIVQFYFKDGELWTVSMDGRVRVWYYEPIDQADPPDDDRVVQVEPAYDFHTPGVEFMYILKQNSDKNCTLHYAQDGNGGLWRIDLNTDGAVRPSVQLYKCHAGPVVDIAVCPFATYLVSLGEDGRLYMYNYMKQKLIFTYQFPAKGRAMIWLPILVQDSGDQLIMGFDDGNVRSVGLFINESTDGVKLFLLQVIKPHSKPITKMSLNRNGSVLVTGGEDKTIFIFKVSSESMHTILIPIGYIIAPNTPTCLTWHWLQDYTVIVGCVHGELLQVTLPSEPQSYTKITYILDLEPITNKFVTYKSQIRRDIKLKEIEAKKEEKRERKRKEMKKIMAENPGLEIDEEIFLEDSESSVTLTPLHVPEVPNRILWIQSMTSDYLWLSLGGFDAGYIYEYKIDQSTSIPSRFRMVYDGDDMEISSYVYNYNQKYLIFAMQDGNIRVNKVKDDYMDLSDYWQLSMHDNLNGFIPKMCFSYDERYFFSCGHDGNVFSYQFFPENDDYVLEYPKRAKIFFEFEYRPVEDDYNYKSLSLEEAIVKAEEDRVLRLANKHKTELRDKLGEYAAEFQALLERNERLLPSQIVPRSFFEIDARITDDLNDRLETELNLVRRKLEFQVEKAKITMHKLLEHFIEPLDVFPTTVVGINVDLSVRTMRQKKIGDEFFQMQDWVDVKIKEAELKGRPPERAAPPPEKVQVREKKDKQLEYFLLGLSPSTIQMRLGAKLTRLLNKYRGRKAKREKRQEEWEDFRKLKPLEGVNHSDDEKALAEAIRSIGDYKLKTALDFKVPLLQRETTVKKYKELLDCRQKQYNLRHNFNLKVYELRDAKVKCRDELEKLDKQLQEIHDEIDSSEHKLGPNVPEILGDDFPENNIKVDVTFPEISSSVAAIKSVNVPPTKDEFERDTLFSDEPVTSWEKECKALRYTRKLFEQDRVIEKMNELIKNYDDTLKHLVEERIQISVSANFIDLHLLKLHQELIVLKDFEIGEDTLQDKVNSKTVELMDMQDSIKELSSQIEIRKSEINTLQESEKKIQAEFAMAVTDNKFYDFLRRIFKKKYKPPRIKDPDDEDDESESESSDDSDEEEDEGSIDSRDFGIIRLDESVCPKGCDIVLFDLTYSLRSQRHQVELRIKDSTAEIAALKKESENLTKKLKGIEASVESTQTELEMYQREKQKRLNQVIVTVVLKLNQIQNLLKDDDYAINKISESLIFSQPSLTKLYKRVGQLQQEAIKQRAKHKINIQHLCRMKTDCQYMGKDIAKLKKDIEEAMIIKFGRVVDIDDLEEAYLRRLVFNLRMSMTDLRSLYERELVLWRNRYEQRQIDLANSIKENTEKLELLTVLNKEKADLASLVHHQQHMKLHLDNLVDVASVYKQDMIKLTEVIDKQKKDIQQLKCEILKLKTKGLSLKELQPPDLSQPEEAEEEEDDGLDWGGTLEEFMDQHWDFYAEQEKVRQLEEDERRSKLKLMLHEATVTHEHEPIVREFKRPEPQDIVKGIVLDLIDDLEVQAPKVRVESVIELVLQKVVNRKNVTDIISVLLENLPIEGTDQQHDMIETAAEKLYSLQEPDLSEAQVVECATDILEEILDTSLSEKGHTIYMISEMVTNLVHELPIDFLMKGSVISMILSRLTSNLSFIEVDKEELLESLTNLTGPMADDIRTLMNVILEKVFGIGIDYLYVLNEKFRKDFSPRFSITLPVKWTDDEIKSEVEVAKGEEDEGWEDCPIEEKDV